MDGEQQQDDMHQNRLVMEGSSGDPLGSDRTAVPTDETLCKLENQAVGTALVLQQPRQKVLVRTSSGRSPLAAFLAAGRQLSQRTVASQGLPPSKTVNKCSPYIWRDQRREQAQ